MKKRKHAGKERGIVENEHADNDTDNVELFRTQLLQSAMSGRGAIDRVIPTLESDWAIKEFDFEHHFVEMDAEERRIEQEYREKERPDFRKRNEVCQKWLRGLCAFPDYMCEGLHIYNPDLFPTCLFYTNATCTNPNCPFRHPGEDEEVLCVEYARGFCKDGVACNFKHRQFGEEERERIRNHVDAAIHSHRESRRRAAALLQRNAEESKFRQSTIAERRKTNKK